jgi:uncharacterized BrkB/YihY/UPF0761 family membrane protein
VDKPAEGRSSRFSAGLTKAKEQQKRYQDKLEKHPWSGFLLAANRRFNKIEGKHLAIVIALNLFVAVIPLIIIGYAFISAFNPHDDVGNMLARNLHLSGSTAATVRDTFTNAQAYGGFGVALALAAGVGLIASFWVWIAAMMGVYWERKAGPAAVAQMEELSAEISGSQAA